MKKIIAIVLVASIGFNSYVHAETYVAKTPTAETRAVSAEVKQAMNSDLPGREKPFEITMANKIWLGIFVVICIVAGSIAYNDRKPI